jgi:hypothetical protein
MGKKKGKIVSTLHIFLFYPTQYRNGTKNYRPNSRREFCTFLSTTICVGVIVCVCICMCDPTQSPPPKKRVVLYIPRAKKGGKEKKKKLFFFFFTLLTLPSPSSRILFLPTVQKALYRNTHTLVVEWWWSTQSSSTVYRNIYYCVVVYSLYLYTTIFWRLGYYCC